MPSPRLYRVELTRGRGAAEQVCGTFGPYAARADALADARALRAPGCRARVVAVGKVGKVGKAGKAGKAGRGPRRNAGPAAAALTQLALQLAQTMAQAKARAFLAATPPERVAMLRRAARYNLPLRLVLRDDARAQGVAEMLASALADGKVDAAVQAVQAGGKA
jgi:hypothetical protein